MLRPIIPTAISEPSSISDSPLANHGLQREAFTELLSVGVVLLTPILLVLQ